MKKRWMIAAVICCLLLLTGCCSHDWTEPSCTQLKTCRLCGKEDGQLLAHSWMVATWEAPMHCVVCGETRGEKPGVNHLVKEACDSALQNAENKKREPSFAVLELRDRILPVVDSLRVGVNAETALRSLLQEDVPAEEALPLLIDMLSYAEATEHRRFGSFMRKLSTLESVSGTVGPFEADITVEDTALLLEELRISPAALGQLMTLLTDEATGGLGSLTYTERGFTFSWQSDGGWVIDLDSEPLPVSEGDLVFYQTASSSEERYSDILQTLRKKHGEEPGFVCFYQYLGYEYVGKVRTARGVSILSPREMVEALYGAGEPVSAGEDGPLYAAMFPGGQGDETQREDFLAQCKTAVEYPVTERVSLVFTFDANDCVAWMIVLQR